jgi:hypothetical protein
MFHEGREANVFVQNSKEPSMSRWTKQYLMSLLVSAAVASNPIAAQAGGMSHMGTMGMSHAPAPGRNGPDCKPNGFNGGVPSVHNSITNVQVYKPVNINNNINVNKPISIDNTLNVYKPVTINNDVNVTNNIDASKTINLNKPITITKSIDNSKYIDITNNIDNSKYIDASKNIEINKSIVINKGSEADASAIASAIASASASASINFFGQSSSQASASGSFYGGNVALEVPAPSFGSDFGSISVEAAPAQARQACTFQDTTVVKAIHALCISADGHQFPASHMVAETWINSSYEGEVARCIPGSHLKVVVGKVMQSNEGMAAGYASGQVLECSAREAIRHYKDGLLKCAAAVSVPDCTERTNLRKYGTGDMFFSYRAKVCLETHEEYSAVEPAPFPRRSSVEGYGAY